ncbi:MAG: rRNA (guanine-N1)-methyltransferase [Chlamydiales bacterium]|jgi:23S rRNA (guanine745-N1)-methyltransferase|nr:rRNA (guanine-N1)-methyltransferase [Chlamydiales bacterium]
MQILACPLCQSSLEMKNRQYSCPLNHSYDIARQGYVNLLLANQKGSKNPGDSYEMAQSRKLFLDKGYYSSISDLLNQTIKIEVENLKNVDDISIVDAGCGEGYYLDKLKHYLETNTITSTKHIRCYGLDISKEAVRFAASRSKHITWLVNSVHHMPFKDNSVSLLISIFSKPDFKEFKRVLNSQAHVIIVAPLAHHLQELRNLIYSETREFTPFDPIKEVIPGFTLKEQNRVEYSIELKNSQEISSLLQMTPYYWSSSQDKRDYIQSLHRLSLTVHAGLWVFELKK